MVSSKEFLLALYMVALRVECNKTSQIHTNDFDRQNRNVAMQTCMQEIQFTLQFWKLQPPRDSADKDLYTISLAFVYFSKLKNSRD